MENLKHESVIVRRPIFYHIPENKCSVKYCREKSPSELSERQTMYELKPRNYLNLPTYNSYPRPFNRSHDGRKLVQADYRESGFANLPDRSTVKNTDLNAKSCYTLSGIYGNPRGEQSNKCISPDTNEEEWMRDKKIERISIAHQTYRTLPIVSPKPKTRHDLAFGSYMNYNLDPTWDLVQKVPKKISDSKFDRVMKSKEARREERLRRANVS